MTVTLYPGYSQTIIQENLRCQTIASITNSNPMMVTTINNHHYVIGMIVTFLIPQAFGMVQLSGISGQVISMTNNTLTIDINSINFGVFAYPSPLPGAYTPPSVIPQASGRYLTSLPLPYGNQDSFEGVVFNNGSLGDPIS